MRCWNLWVNRSSLWWLHAKLIVHLLLLLQLWGLELLMHLIQAVELALVGLL